MNLNFLNRKGQGSLEYLLIIGGAIAIAAIVIFMVLSTAQQPPGEESSRRQQIVQECTAKCADDSYCDSESNDWDSTATCIDACRDSGYLATAVNVRDCEWDCTVDNDDTVAAVATSTCDGRTGAAGGAAGTEALSDTATSNSGGWIER